MPTNDEINDALEGWEFWRKYLSEYAPQAVVRERGDDLARLLREVVLERDVAAAAEREACALLVEDDLARINAHIDSTYEINARSEINEAYALRRILAAIRARGEKEEA